jgi:hypothetical protein
MNSRLRSLKGFRSVSTLKLNQPPCLCLPSSLAPRTPSFITGSQCWNGRQPMTAGASAPSRSLSVPREEGFPELLALAERDLRDTMGMLEYHCQMRTFWEQAAGRLWLSGRADKVPKMPDLVRLGP